METYLETMASEVIEYNEHRALSDKPKKNSTPDVSESAKSQNSEPLTLKRRGSGAMELEKEVTEQERHADEDINIHWPAERRTAERQKRWSVRRSSSLTMDMTDSVINFRDEDGSYTSDSNHYDLENCSCTRKRTQ